MYPFTRWTLSPATSSIFCGDETPLLQDFWRFCKTTCPSINTEQFHISIITTLCCFSRNVHPCRTVPISQLLHCPPQPNGAALSTPAMSTLATSCWFVHYCKVHPCNMVPHCPLLQYPPLPHRADTSTPALFTPANSAFPMVLDKNSENVTCKYFITSCWQNIWKRPVKFRKCIREFSANFGMFSKSPGREISRFLRELRWTLAMMSDNDDWWLLPTWQNWTLVGYTYILPMTTPSMKWQYFGMWQLKTMRDFFIQWQLTEEQITLVPDLVGRMYDWK